MRKMYKIASEQGRQFASDQGVSSELEDERELELSMQQEKAMIAAGWIEGPIEPKEKKGGSK